MLAKISITCFAASYGVVLALEVSRLVFRSGVRGAVMLGFAGAGLFAHTAFLYHRAATAAGSPLSNERDWYLVAAWVLAAAYFGLTCHQPKASFGLFLLPLVLGLVATAAFLADPAPFAADEATTVWGWIHGASLLAATVAVLVGLAAGLMYLGQAYRLKHKLPPRRGFRLPSLEWLGQLNGRALVVSLVMLAAGVLSGIVLNQIRGPDQVPWTDPVVLSTLGMFGWLLVAVAAGFFYRPARQGRKVAYLTVVSALFLAIALAAGLFANSRHGQAPTAGGNSASGQAAVAEPDQSNRAPGDRG